MLPPLPIDPHIPEVVARLRERRAVVISAPPGAGKTTRVPPALAEDGRVILLQPRRVAARSIASRIAEERGWTLGREVGWQVRFERQFTAATRVLLATEGILTARLQQDPLLSGFHTVVLDEFHERSIHADLGLALARQAWLARDDLRIVVMSATLDTSLVAAFLGACPVLRVPAAGHALSMAYAPSISVAEAARDALATTPGNVLCFLAGAPEIRRAHPRVAAAAAPFRADTIVLHGSLSAADQDAALAATRARRVILATNIAETSLTVPGVRAVIDAGLHKVARYDAGRAIDRLDVERIPQSSADQRAGRAGRLGPGAVWRLWDRTDRLQPHLEAEIHRVDLAGPVLDILAWGGDLRQLELLERPPDGALEAAFELLRRLGAVAGSQLTEIGRRLHRLPLHPRLSRILTDAGGAREAALACALLAEGRGAPVPDEATASDLLTAIGNERLLSPHVLRVARELQRLAGTEPAPAGPRAGAGILDERRFRRALLAGYPDRVARRRLPGSPRVLMASGHGAVVTADSGVRDGEFILALDVIGSRHGEGAEARIRMASIVDRDWLRPTDIRIEHVFDEVSQEVRAFEREYYDALVLAERPARPEEVEAAASLGEAYLRRPVSREDEQLLRRLRFVGRSVPIEALVRAAAAGKRRLPDVHLLDALPWELREVLDRDAPARLRLPSGRTVRLEYREDGGVMAEVRLEELFGVAESPRVGPRAEPVLLALLAPNGRPVQLTRDLRSFWERTYPEVRRELSGRYPKHTRRWPEKP